MTTNSNTHYTLDIGSNHAPYRAMDDEYATYEAAETAAKSLHHPDWPPDRCVIIRNMSNHRPAGYTVYQNGKVIVRPT